MTILVVTVYTGLQPVISIWHLMDTWQFLSELLTLPELFPEKWRLYVTPDREMAESLLVLHWTLGDMAETGTWEQYICNCYQSYFHITEAAWLGRPNIHLKNSMIQLSLKSSFHLKDKYMKDQQWLGRLIDWLLGFNTRAAIFQLYSGDEHEVNDKMNMKWWWNEKWDGTQG